MMDHDANLPLRLEFSGLVFGRRHMADIGLELLIGGHERLGRQQAVMRQAGIAILECSGGYPAEHIHFAVDANEADAISIKKWRIIEE